MLGAQYLLIAAFALVGLSRGEYDFDDPEAGHTNQAIKFDGEGDKLASLRSFQSSVRFTPTSETWANLGVCSMRLGTATPMTDFDGKVAWYHKAHAAIQSAKTAAVTDAEWQHVDENSKALKQSMKAEGVDAPQPHEALDPMSLPEGAAGPKRSPRRPPSGGTLTGADGAPVKKRRRKKGTGEGSAAPTQPTAPFRERLLHQRAAPLAPPLPRVSVEELDSEDPAFLNYRERKEPFILTGGMAGWRCVDEWPLTWAELLPRLFPHAVTDFYPHNMLSTDRQNPYLTRLPRAVKEILVEPGPAQQREGGSAFEYDRTALAGRYMHLQLTPKMWMELEDRGDISALRHWHLSSDEWLEECLGFPDDSLAEEYHLKTHWKIILTGARGAGMFNHSDSLMTSSWHAHVLGSKWWHVCGTLANGTRGACFEDYLVPGETLYYGRGWHHETQNLETPTMTLTDTVAHAQNWEHIATQLHATCTHDKLRFDFSARMCDALDGCYAKLHEMHTGRPKPAHLWPPWRSLASPEHVKKREAMQPQHNNYDGRNYITEL